ncbi:MAG TPA: deoxyribose-phosphate aldolase [Acidothermaceae bacterium]
MTPTTLHGRVIPDTVSPADIAAMIDHSLLRPELTADDVRAGCALAAARGTLCVCVKAADVRLAAAALAGTAVRVGTVVGFPHGSSATAVKRYEAERALADGAVEIDMVVNIGALRGGDDDYVGADIGEVVTVAHAADALVKVILENAYLDDEQIARGSRLVEAAGADFVKTSTGFAPSGATMHDLLIMAASTSPAVRLKAAGGVRTLDRLLDLIAIGVTRFGATATATILDDAEARAAATGSIPVPPAPADERATDIAG